MLEDLLENNSMVDLWREQGLARGMAQGMRRSVEVAVQGRFGLVNEDIRRAIEQANVGALTEVLAHLTTDTLEQMRARLGLN